MVESVGMQQVLQLSNYSEKLQMAQQAQAGDMARVFDHELEKTVEHQKDQTQATRESEKPGIRDEDQRKQKHYARTLPERHPVEEEEKKEEAAPPPEIGHGAFINIVA